MARFLWKLGWDGSQEGVLWELSVAYQGIFFTRVKRENTDLNLGLVAFSEP